MNPNNQANSSANPTVWYIQVLSFMGSAIGGMFFLIFLGILDVLNSESVIAFIGFVSIAVVIVLSNILPEESKQSKNPILLSFFLQGYGLFLFGFDQILDPSYKVFLIINICLQMVFYFSFQNSIYRILAVLIGSCSIFALMDEANLLYLYPYFGAILLGCLVYLQDDKRLIERDPYLFYSVAISFLGLFILPHISSKDIDLSKVMSFVFLLITMCYLIYLSFKNLSKVWIYGIVFILSLLFLPLINAPGVFASHIILFIGIRKNSLFLTNLARLSLIGYFIILYYQMQITLLQKSLYMLGSGILFLLVYLGWVFYERKFNSK